MTEIVDFDFDVAVSFAGEDRPFVAKVVELLKASGVKVFYDQDEQAAMWGENLVEILDGVYQNRARFAIVFVSRHYAEKAWPNFERQSAQARALVEKQAYMLPVRLDGTTLPGLRPTISYLDGLAIGAQGVVDAFLQKLSVAQPHEDSPPTGELRSVPATAEGIQRLVDEKPVHWEYTLYGALLRRGIAALSDKRRDHDLELSSPSGRTILDGEVLDVARQASNDSLVLADRFNRILDPAVSLAAFGAPGEPGDAEAINHAATRLVDIYRDWLDWAAGLRGISTTESKARRILEALAHYADQPLKAISDMAADYVRELDRFLASDDPEATLHLTLTVTWEIPDDVQGAFDSALEDYAQ